MPRKEAARVPEMASDCAFDARDDRKCQMSLSLVYKSIALVISITY